MPYNKKTRKANGLGVGMKIWDLFKAPIVLVMEKGFFKFLFSSSSTCDEIFMKVNKLGTNFLSEKQSILLSLRRARNIKSKS